MVFTITQFSDLHITSGKEFSRDVFMKGIGMIRNIHSDLAICTGDITNTGLRDDYEMASKLLKDVKPWIHFVIGNHDARNVGNILFEEFFGESAYSYEGEKFKLLVYDSNIPDLNEGRFGRDQIKELRKDLRGIPSDKIKIVAFHHHVLPIYRTGRERNMLKDAGDVLQTLLDYNVDVVLNGHKHTPSVYHLESTLISNTGGFSVRKVRAGMNHSFNTITLYDNGRNDVSINDIENGESKKYFSHNHVKDRIFVPREKVLRLVHISDTHFTQDKEFKEGVFDRGVRIINSLKPDLIVHTGDVTHEGLPDQFELAKEQMDRFEAPLVVLAGPHDMLHLGPDLFEEYFGDNTKVIEEESFVLMGLNSSDRLGPLGRIGKGQLELIREKANETDSFKVVAFHHHVLPVPHTAEQYVIEDAGDVLKTLADESIDIVLTGHGHKSSFTKIEDSLVINANTISSRRVLAQYYNTFNIIDVTNNGIAIIKERSVFSKSNMIRGIYKLPFSMDGDNS